MPRLTTATPLLALFLRPLCHVLCDCCATVLRLLRHTLRPLRHGYRISESHPLRPLRHGYSGCKTTWTLSSLSISQDSMIPASTSSLRDSFNFERKSDKRPHLERQRARRFSTFTGYRAVLLYNPCSHFDRLSFNSSLCFHLSDVHPKLNNEPRSALTLRKKRFFAGS